MLLSLGLVAACGGGKEDPPSPPVTSAAELVPDLTDAGFRVDTKGKLPSLTPGQDAYLAIFAGSKPSVSSVRVELNLLQSADAASTQFAAIADALRNPPPDLFGPGTTQADGTPVYDTDGERSYVTSRPDAQGNLVYTDAYRMGRVIAIVYTLGSDAEAAKAVRRLVAERIDARAPR